MRVPRVPYRPIKCIDHGYRGSFKYVVIHDEEGEDADAYFRSCRQPDLVGAHFQVKKDGSSVQWADTTRLVYHAVGGNHDGVGIELGGYARFTRAQWLARKSQLREAARITGYLLAKKHVFPRHGTTVLGHYQLPAGGHTDPGPGFPWDTFMMYVRLYYRLYRAKIVAKLD